MSHFTAFLLGCFIFQLGCNYVAVVQWRRGQQKSFDMLHALFEQHTK